MYGVGGGVIGHAEVHRPVDIPEPDIVVAADAVGGEGRLLTVDVECLAAGSGGEVICRLDGGAAEDEAGEDAESHEDRFPFSITISLVGTLGSQPGVSSVSRQSYNERSNWLTIVFLGIQVR